MDAFIDPVGSKVGSTEGGGSLRGFGRRKSCCRIHRRLTWCSLEILEVAEPCGDVIWQPVPLSLAGFLRGVCVSEGWEWARELWQLAWEVERRIQNLLGRS